jgi:hypothetical protein
MDLSSDQLADLLIGIARAQNALIEAIERSSPGFRSGHAVPVLNVAANMRAGDPRMIDLPSRLLLRLQGRVALDPAAVKADLERLLSAKAGGAAPAGAAPAAGAKSAMGSPLDDLDFNIKS